MSVLRVVEPGMLTAVQDLGRLGYGVAGVPPSGAFDSLSLITGNRLLGNADGDAGLECTLVGPSVTFDRDLWICLTGAQCPEGRIAGRDGERQVPWCEPVRVHAGELVKLGRLRDGARSCLCVTGGIGVPEVLGSRSTLAGAGFGGFEGRPLRRGDVVPLGAPEREPRTALGDVRRWLHSVLDRRSLRVVPSLHADRFPPSAMDRLVGSEFTVDDQSNRVGLRLRGGEIPTPEDAGSFESEPTVDGGVQIPGDAMPVILGADRPTTGGYALLACVIGADLPLIATLRPRDVLRFELVSLAAARRLTAEQRGTLDDLLPPSDRGAVG